VESFLQHFSSLLLPPFAHPYSNFPQQDLNEH
jgi:hypothetical protein